MGTPNLDNEKIYIYIYDFGSENQGSHAALQFGEEIIDFSPKGFSEIRDQDRHECRVYTIDPKQINVKPEKLLEAIKKRKEKITGSNYFYFGENCAKQVCAVLREAGAKNLPDETGLDIPTPTMQGMSRVIKDKIGIPIIGDVAGKLVQTVSHTAKIVTGQETLEEYCQQNGRLAEVRQASATYHRTRNEFKKLMQILHDPQAYQQEMIRRRDLELAGRDPDGGNSLAMELYKQYKDTLSPEEAERVEKQYRELFQITPPSAQEQISIRARYAREIALSRQPAEKLKQRALSLLLSSKGDKLLQNELIRIADETAPEIALEYKLKAEQIMKNIPFARPTITDSKINTPQTHPSFRNPEQGRYS